MLSINYIYNFLDNKQENINKSFYDKINDFELNKNISIQPVTVIEKSNKLDKFNFDLPKSFDILFNKSIINFYYDNKIYKNKSPVFTLLNSFFLIGNEFFNLNDENEKTLIMKEFLKKIDDDLFQRDLYLKFDYSKNRNFNKGEFQEIIKNVLQFKICDKFNLFKNYLSDYLGINLYIFHKINDLIDFDKSEFYLTKYYNNNNKYVPHFLILYENEFYKPILTSGFSSILKYSEHQEIIDNIWKYFKIEENVIVENSNVNVSDENKEVIENENENKNKKYNINKLKNLKVDEIKKICQENNIELLKKSDKTNKMINKLKIELITELLNI